MEQLHGRIRVVEELHLAGDRSRRVVASTTTTTATLLLSDEGHERERAARVRAVELGRLVPVVAAREHDVLVAVLVRVAEGVAAANAVLGVGTCGRRTPGIAEVGRGRQLRPVRGAARRVALAVRPRAQARAVPAHQLPDLVVAVQVVQHRRERRAGAPRRRRRGRRERRPGFHARCVEVLRPEVGAVGRHGTARGGGRPCG